MASKEFNVVAVLYPRKGKTDEVLDLMRSVGEYVQANEPGVLTYSINRSLRPNKDGTEDIVMIEKYQNKQTLKEHGSSKIFTAFQKQMGEKDFMRAPMMLKMVSQTGGFSSRL